MHCDEQQEHNVQLHARVVLLPQKQPVELRKWLSNRSAKG
jgi:tRNA A22 N-methylase